jgi:hypothetical protein
MRIMKEEATIFFFSFSIQLIDVTGNMRYTLHAIKMSFLLFVLHYDKFLKN